ncbi:hypothetical protein [Methylorubrum thiocyanatum]|uniref:hypothetical protein n=1 Tax=Methylorubrum thiocyanatum TaxID=47958 RepID=UPI00398C53E6
MLRLVEPSPCSDETFQVSNPSPKQLSLFDLRPVCRVLCLPMADIHGATFARAISQCRRGIVLDARAYPYFDLPGLNRSMVSRLFDELSCAYVQAPLDLRPPRDQASRWHRRQVVRAALMEQVKNSSPGHGWSAIVLLNHVPEVSVMDEALRGLAGDEDRVWHVQLHEALAPLGTN